MKGIPKSDKTYHNYPHKILPEDKQVYDNMLIALLVDCCAANNDNGVCPKINECVEEYSKMPHIDNDKQFREYWPVLLGVTKYGGVQR